MKEPKGLEKNNNQKASVCAAFKAHNEIYYQMASILYAISHDQGEAAQKIFSKYLTDQSSEIFLEKNF
ncbi:MAG: hypothetical protein ABIJ31_07890 [Pseudomonadota bacterium]